MKLTDLFLGELDREGPLTRRALEAVPEGRGDWKPHAKSMPLGRLAGLVAMMPSWLTMIVEKDELDVVPPAGTKSPSPLPFLAASIVLLFGLGASALALPLRRSVGATFPLFVAPLSGWPPCFDDARCLNCSNSRSCCGSSRGAGSPVFAGSIPVPGVPSSCCSAT